jgi:hypothetical protein
VRHFRKKFNIASPKIKESIGHVKRKQGNYFEDRY